MGFSEGLHAEVKKYGIDVTTVVPGLMRTGSFVNAYFKGRHRAEYSWFSVSAAVPGFTIQARRAARQIVSAIQRGTAEITLTPQAKLLAWFHGLFPGLTSEMMSYGNHLLPSAEGGSKDRWRGKESENAISKSPITEAGREAAKEYHQYPGENPARA